ncbi:MAG TPA: glutaredoxin family protein [Pyrinomonadaceae bacterium]|nr:glutaredoxin family protein [Pyrinomonadaceae bacterium]
MLTEERTEGGERDEARPASAVTLYVVPGCPLCSAVRGWLDERGVPDAERDVANDFGALRSMYRLTRQRLVPVVETDGRAAVRPSNAELKELLRV